MEPGLIGAVIGGVIGISGGILTTVLFHHIDKKRRRNSIINTAIAEITAVKKKAERFIKGESNLEELRSSTPLWSSSLALELGFISINQAVATRRAITLDMEMRKTGRKEKAEQCKKACQIALEIFKTQKKLHYEIRKIEPTGTQIP